MRHFLAAVAFLMVLPLDAIAATTIKHPTKWHADYSSGNFCSLTTQFYSVSSEASSIETPTMFILEFKHYDQSLEGDSRSRGYPVGNTISELSIMLKGDISKELDEATGDPSSKGRPHSHLKVIEKFRPLITNVNGVRFLVSHSKSPFLMTAGAGKASDLMSRLRESDTIDVRVETAVGTSYQYTIQHLDFRVRSAMFEGCAKAMSGTE